MVAEGSCVRIGTFPNLGTGFLNPGNAFALSLRRGSYLRSIDSGGSAVKRIHVFLIAALLGVAALAGMFAATRTVSLGVAGKNSRDAAVAARTRQLDAYAASLRQALAHKPPALPKVPAAKSSSLVQAGSPRVIYHRPAPIVIVKHRHQGDDGSEQGDGGGRDD